MKTKLTYLLLLFVVLSSCEEQDPELFNKEFLGQDGEYTFVTPDQYTGVPSSKRTSFFLDKFDNNVNNWGTVNDNDLFVNIERGNLIFESKGPAYFTTITKPFDKSKDFEIETSIKIVTGNSSLSANTNGFVWFVERTSNNRIASFNNFVFDDTRFWIGKYESNNYRSWQNWTQSIIRSYGNYNKLTVRKIQNQYHFFVNEQFILSVPYENRIGDRIGFRVKDKCRLEIDYLKIDYIN